MIQGKPRVYVASPFGGNTHLSMGRKIDYGFKCLEHSILLGEAPFAPHLLYPHVLADTGDDRAEGIMCGLNWLRMAEILALYIDLGKTEGMLGEQRVAIKLGITVEERRLNVAP